MTVKRHTDCKPARPRGFALSVIKPPALSRLAGRSLSLLLAALMLLTIVPHAAAEEAEGDSILVSLDYIIGKDVIKGVISGHDVIFTVPYRFAGTGIDFTSGLSPDYASGYKDIVLQLSGKAVVGDESSYASLLITYRRSEDSPTDDKRSVTYRLYARRADPVAATFYGTADVPVQTGTTKAIPAKDIRDLYQQNDGAPLTHIAIFGSNPVFGTLLLDGSLYTFGETIPIEALDAGRLAFSATNTGVVSFDVKAFAGGDTSAPVGAVATLTISSYTTPKASGPIELDVTKERLFTFRLEDFSSRCELYNIPVDAVIFTPQKTSAGTWLYKGSAMRTGTAVTIPASDVRFLEFNATVSGTAGFTWQVQTAGGKTAVTSGTITVHSIALELEDYVSPTSLGKGGVHSVAASHFKYKITSELQGAVTPTYLKITQIPPTKDGYLYLAEALPKAEDGSYPAIAAETALKVGAIIPFSYAGQLRIASNSTSTSDSITFSWTLTADRVIKTADWAAPALYTVPFSEGEDLMYMTDTGVPVTFRVDDFREALLSATGASLSYVTFTLPNKEQGTLYYNYNLLKKTGTAVTASSKYYYGRSPSLAQVTFVPAADFYGTCVFTYTAFSDSGVRVSGKVTVIVYRNAGGTVVLVADKNAPLDLDAEAFRSAFKTATGKELESIQFTNTSTNAALYTGYIGPGQYGSVVTTGTRLYLYAAPLLSRTTFVPNTGFTGTVTYNYHARSTKNESYYGRLVVFVVESEGGNVCYSVNTNGYVRLRAGDFTSAFTAATGSILSYVTFTPPAKTAGTLYETYSPATGKGTAVKSNTKYMVYDSPSISDIYFVPAENFSGTIDVAFTATSQAGTSYTGKLKFLVGRGEEFGRAYIRLSAHAQPGAPMPMNADAFRAAFLRATGQILAGVRFTPPSSYEGRLCTGYISPSSPGTLVSDTTRYLLTGSPNLSGVVFVPAANFGSGTVAISFDAYAADGTAYAGHLTVYVGSAAPFDDIGGYPWAADPIAFLADVGVVLGTGNGKFNPNKSITRADFVLMVARAFELSGGSSSFPDVQPGAYYYAAVVAAKALGIIQGSGGYFHPNAALTRQDAMVILKKTADVLGIKLPTNKGSLSQFADADKIADYAVEAAQALVAAGVINGSDGKLNPRSSISRAEMATVLYRVLLLKSK